MTESLAAAREDLAAALRMADRLGMSEGVCNHFSVMVPGRDDQFLINPNRVHWSAVTAAGLPLLDRDGTLIAGDEPPEPTAFFIHWRLHVAAPQARAILHTHMPYATALTLLDDPTLLPVSQSALFFHGQVAYDRDYNGLALDAAEGDRMAARLGNGSVLFLANHGVIVTGTTVAEAFNRLYYLERAAMHQVMALSTGRKLRLIPEGIAQKTRQQIAEDEADMSVRHMAEIKRMLDRDDPGWRG